MIKDMHDRTEKKKKDILYIIAKAYDIPTDSNDYLIIENNLDVLIAFAKDEGYTDAITAIHNSGLTD